MKQLCKNCGAVHDGSGWSEPLAQLCPAESHLGPFSAIQGSEKEQNVQLTVLVKVHCSTLVERSGVKVTPGTTYNDLLHERLLSCLVGEAREKWHKQWLDGLSATVTVYPSISCLSGNATRANLHDTVDSCASLGLHHVVLTIAPPVAVSSSAEVHPSVVEACDAFFCFFTDRKIAQHQQFTMMLHVLMD